MGANTKHRNFAANLILTIGMSTLLSCSNSQSPGVALSDNQRVADLQVVDCLLPGQIRRLGNSTYMTPRRPILTTAADCRIRGGEYVDYDRADYRTALNIWIASAEAGDVESQVNVGEIFERGTGGAPNYEAAAIWYQRAADQGNSRAQFNLGTLYEQGLGVEQNKMTALNLYRQAWGLPEDDLIFQSAAYREQQELRDQLQQDLDERNGQIQVLQRQLNQLQEELEQQQNNADLQMQLQQLQNLVADLEQERDSTQNQFMALPVLREPAPISENIGSTSSSGATTVNTDFGRFYALVIGNQNYTRIDDLQSPLNDATRVAELLQNKYGFSVQTLLDASNYEVMQAVNDLNDVLNEEDNLLIFYAGHGSRLQTGQIETGYWLPVNADPPPTDTFWVSNEAITRHLARLKAKRILVVADSCYAGLLSDAPGFILGGEQQSYDADYLRYKLPKRARLLLSSGGDSPVLDNLGGQGHSIFARAFLDVLESNDRIIAGPDLFIQVRDMVSSGARAVEFNQEPEFKAIKGAGHEVGDFFFVPVANL